MWRIEGARCDKVQLWEVRLSAAEGFGVESRGPPEIRQDTIWLSGVFSIALCHTSHLIGNGALPSTAHSLPTHAMQAMLGEARGRTAHVWSPPAETETAEREAPKFTSAS